MSDPCKCKCGYSCGRKCGLPIMQCIEKHYVRDCEHEWDGWEEHTDIGHDGKPYVSGGSRVCSKCGVDAMSHDLRQGP